MVADCLSTALATDGIQLGSRWRHNGQVFTVVAIAEAAGFVWIEVKDMRGRLVHLAQRMTRKDARESRRQWMLTVGEP